MNAAKRKCGRKPKERNVNPVSAAVFTLRSQLGLSQQAMSQQLGMAMVTIAKYEAGRVPDFLSLVKLEKLARRFEKDEIAGIFRGALIENLGVWGEAGNTLSLSLGEAVKKLRQNLQLSQEALSDYEAAMVEALLTVIRNPKLAATVKQIEQHLAACSGLTLPEKTQ